MSTSSGALPAWLAGNDEDEEKGEEKTSGEGHSSPAGEAPVPNERTALTASEESGGEELEEEIVHRGPVLTFFVGVSALSILAAVCLGVAHGASLYAFVARARSRDSRRAVDVALRAYGLVFCLAICVVELELGPTARSSVVSRFWTLRGAFYTLVGLMALDAADEDERRLRDGHDRPAWLSDGVLPYVLYLRSTAMAVLSLGLLYVALGLCCCKHLRERLVLDHRKQLAKAQLRSAIIAELAIKRQRPADDDADT